MRTLKMLAVAVGFSILIGASFKADPILGLFSILGCLGIDEFLYYKDFYE